MARKLPERVRVESNHRARLPRASLYSPELRTLGCETGVVTYPREIGQARTGTYPDHNRALYPVKLQAQRLPVMPFAHVQRSQMALVKMYDGIPALGLGPVEGYVCPRDQPADVVTRFPPASPCAEGEERLFAVGQHYEALAQVFGDALQYPLCRLSFLCVPHAHHELIASPPCDPVPRAHVAAQNLCEVDDAGVPGAVAMRIIYGLELVEVQQCQGERSTSAFGPLDVFGKALVRGPAVVGACEVVPSRQVLQGAHCLV